MPDITMCKGLEENLLRICNKCYRNERYTRPSEYGQSYFAYPPIDMESFKCEYFLSINEEKEK